jgi:signal transduction histidine kinase
VGIHPVGVNPVGRGLVLTGSGMSSTSRQPVSAPERDDCPQGGLYFIGGLLLAAIITGSAVAWLDTSSVSWLAVLTLSVAITVGEALRVDLPFRSAGQARYGLGDLSLTAGLLIFSGTEIVLAATLAAIASSLVDRLPINRTAFNIPQFVLASSLAALVMTATGTGAGRLTPLAFAAAALAATVFTLSNAVSVSTIIVLTSRASWIDSFRRMAPIGLLIAAGNAALALWAVIVLQTHPWALPAFAVPLVLMYSASRQEVRAKVDRERSDVYVSVEQSLSDTSDPEVLAATLVNGTRRLLGCSAAVWRNGKWIGEVPEGSSECPVDPGLAVPLVALGPGRGPAPSGRGVAIGHGAGGRVVWVGAIAGGRPPRVGGRERLAQSGRAQFERAAAASALAQEQATLRAVVDGTRDGICVIDTDGLVRLWNPAMARMSGIPASQALDVSAWRVLGEGPWTTDGVHDVIREGGERVWRASVSSVRDDRHGSLKVAVFHDVTAERRVARMKDDMLAVVSHELRTPLTPIKASAQLLRRRWERMGARDRDSLLERIEERSDHLARLVADILLVGQLSASDGPQLEVDLTKTDLAAVLHELVATQRSLHTTHDLALTTPDVVPATTDPVRVRQIMENLLDNACKYSQPGTRVEVTLSVGSGSATLRVADQGRGIPADDLDRVFERFERVEDPLVMTTSGAGLGLYIVRSLVTALGGTVDIASALGRGTTVTVQLPLRPARADHPTRWDPARALS